MYLERLFNALWTLAFGLLFFLFFKFILKKSFFNFDSSGTKSYSLDRFKSLIPTTPENFGYKTNWIAVKSTHIDDVLAFFNPKKSVQTNWKIGLDTAINNNQFIFISPPVDGWIFIIDNSGLDLDKEPRKKILASLSQQFGEAQMFGSHSVVGFAAWAKYEKGQEIRSFIIADGTVQYNNGELSFWEKKLIDSRKEEIDWNDEEDVKYFRDQNFINLLGQDGDHLLLAEEWSINTMSLNLNKSEGLGYLFKAI